jgi:VanZ family protein
MANQQESARPELAYRRFWLVCGWVLVLFVIYLSLTPEPVQLTVEQGDKFGHVFAYATLMSWFANVYEKRTQRLRCALGFIALAVALEFAQRWTGYRSFELADMAAGTAGVLAGWFLASPRIPNYLRWIESLVQRARQSV